MITHTVPLERGPEMYKTFRDKRDGCIKVICAVTAPDGDRCMDRAVRPFAIVTGASGGIGFELAAGAGSGNNDKAKSLPRGWSSSMRPGRRPT